MVLAGGLGLIAAWFGCGGKAVVDDSQPGTGGGSSTADGRGGPYELCMTTTPIADLVPCGAEGGPGSCNSALCDGVNRWVSSCDDNGCVCYFNGAVRCSCISDGAGQFCDGKTPSCCPSPFPEF